MSAYGLLKHQRAPKVDGREVEFGPSYRRTQSVRDIAVKSPEPSQVSWTKAQTVNHGALTFSPLDDRACLNARKDFGNRFTARLLEKVNVYAGDNDIHLCEGFYPVLYRLLRERMNWGVDFAFRGLSSFKEYLMEWTELILENFKYTLIEADIYGLVAVSQYPYMYDKEVWRAFCELWSPLTNTLHHGGGEMGISLNDLKQIGGLPILGEPYDEFLPINEDLLDETKFSPLVVELLRVHANLCKHHNREEVSWWRWITHFYRGEKVFEAWGEDSDKGRKYFSSSPVESSSKDKSKEPLLLSISDKGELAAFLALLLSRFVLPEGSDSVRPETFVMASMMAEGKRVSLAPTVLGHIYHGLGQMASYSGNPGRANPKFAIHFVIGWLAELFPALYRSRPDDEFPEGYPLIIRYAGVRGTSKSLFGARQVFRDPKYVSYRAIPFGEKKAQDHLDMGDLKDSYFEQLVCIRSSWLPVRVHKSFIIEPYYPNRFARQFGYDQGIPANNLQFTFAQRDQRSLEAIATAYAQLFLRNTGAFFCIPNDLHLGACSWDYCTWWVKVSAPYLSQSLKKVHTILTKKDSNSREPIFVITNLRDVSAGIRRAVKVSNIRSSPSREKPISSSHTHSKEQNISGPELMGDSSATGKAKSGKRKTVASKRPSKNRSPDGDVNFKRARYERSESSDKSNSGDRAYPFEDVPVDKLGDLAAESVKDPTNMPNTDTDVALNEAEVTNKSTRAESTRADSPPIEKLTPLQVLPVSLKSSSITSLPGWTQEAILKAFKSILEIISASLFRVLSEKEKAHITSSLTVVRAMVTASNISTTEVDWFETKVSGLLEEARIINEETSLFEKVGMMDQQHDDCIASMESIRTTLVQIQDEIDLLGGREREILEEEIQLQKKKEETAKEKEEFQQRKIKLEGSLQTRKEVAQELLAKIEQIRNEQLLPLEEKKAEMKKLIETLTLFVEN